jgi:hypothetical protein
VKRGLWHLQQMAVRLGFAGIAGLAMMLAAALLQFSWIQPAGRELAGMQVRLAELREQPPAPQQAGVQQQLARFYRFFPQQEALSQQVRTLHAVTQGQQLSTGRVDYKLSRVSGTPLLRYGVSYALVTDYPALRIYLAELLRTLPNAALEEIELQRSGDNVDLIEAKIGLALYFREMP